MVEHVSRPAYIALAGRAPDTPGRHARHRRGVCAHRMTEVRADMDKPLTGLLGDTTARDYADKLSKFNAYAKPELRRLVRGLDLRPGMQVLYAGCGTGDALNWLLSEVTPSARVVGVDLAAAHVAAARLLVPPEIQIHQADLFDAMFEPASFEIGRASC